MYAHRLRYFYLALLILPNLCASLSSGHHSRRRPALNSSKHSIEDVTQKSETIADQLALAASRTETNQLRRGGAYSSDGDGYPNGNLEMNLVRPESEPVHTQITAKYTTNISTHKQPISDLGSLEDSETAEEYVAKAMDIYGTRLKEPIHIPSEELEQIKITPARSQANGNYKLKKQQNIHTKLEQQEKTYAKGIQEAEMQKHLHAQLQEQFLAEKQTLDPQTEYDRLSAMSQLPAPVYEKDPFTRSYEVYDENAAYKGTDTVDRYYHTKYVNQPLTFYRGSQSEQEEKIRVSSSTEIPKSEIMKQIEKSVMKYMKELEAEGKIITTPQDPQTYFKVVSAPLDEKRISSTTIGTKFKSSTPKYNSVYGGTSPPTHAVSSDSSAYSSANRHHMPKHATKTRYSTDSEPTVYQAPILQQHQDMSEALTPNVEFIYKIKTRAPLQAATLNTVSKPYSLPLKGSYDQFDHSAALKNIEEFDLSHVVTTQEPEEYSSSISSASVTSGKPSKLYFNSKIYHDINSLPYKPEKSRPPAAGYRKVKASDLNMADFKGYSGYFAEPATADTEKEITASSSGSGSEDGYPIMNPYQYILKKEPIPSKYDDSPLSSANWDQSRKQLLSALIAQKSLEYDSYSPKFNKNPEGYGYQHTYKSDRERDQQHKYTSQRNVSGKRGKRGGAPHPNVNQKGVRSAKDIEASLALRPPPKL